MEKELTYKVIGCAMKVHNTLGNGFQEVIYQRCLAIELQKEGIDFQREVEQEIYYEGHNVGIRRADFIIDNSIVVELKALIKLEDVHLAQAKNYLTAYNFDIGLLINFGATSLEYKKVFHNRLSEQYKKSEAKLSELKNDQNVNSRSNNPDYKKSENPKIK
ncbi:MAG TPA: GxxExxY protein [Saprospiraceae bacterium]|nr:GxxExxY protein [Saprospiraceae bacterium]